MFGPIAKKRYAAYLTGLVLLLGVGCTPADPIAEVHEERGRWNVTLLDWTATEDGAFSISARVSGPPNAGIDSLTYRIKMYDGSEQVLEEVWRTIDLEEVPRGGPKDLLFKLRPTAAGAEGIQGMTIDLALNPTPEETAKIRELQL